MVTIGVDPHKRWHTAVAVDDNGRRLAERTVRAAPAGHLELLAWARQRSDDRRWAPEVRRHPTRRLERDLLTPVPVWTGNVSKHRLSRGGNPQVNLCLHRIAVTQMQRPGPGREHIAKRMAAGDTRTEAIRALRRRIGDEVLRRMRRDNDPLAARQEPLAMAA